jgi:sec-independent protein translocase protein TatA
MGFVNVGPLELLVIGIIALIVLGPARLPEAARSVGKGIREFRESLSGESDEEREDLPERS